MTIIIYGVTLNFVFIYILNIGVYDMIKYENKKNNSVVLNVSIHEDSKNVLALGLYTPSQSIATAELRPDSLQIIIGILAHAKFPATKEQLIHCAKERNANNDVIDFIKDLPPIKFKDLCSVIYFTINKKINETKMPNSNERNTN